MKSTSYAVGAATVEFWAPTIKTQFWYPEDARTADEWNAVQARVEQDSRDEGLFVSENMAATEAARYLRCLDDPRYELYTVEGETFVEPVYRYDAPGFAGAHLLTDSERGQLREACNQEQARFAKRLRAYLKRYGLSKCQFDTYWSNR